MATMLNVLDYGPTYSGSVVTNLRELIKKAVSDTTVTDVPTFARTLYVPKGQYELEQMISTENTDFASLTSLRLVGDGAVISRGSAFTGRFFIFVSGENRSLSLDGDITFDGKTAPTGGSPPAGITSGARVAVVLAGTSPDHRARGLYVGPRVRFQNFWWRQNSTSSNIDHAVQAWYCREVEVHCQSTYVRGWTVWLETVDDFLVSDCRVDTCEWGGIQMRRAVRRGVVTGNQVRNNTGAAGDNTIAIDMLGETDVDSLGNPVLNERVIVAHNWMSTNAAYGAGLRVKGCSHVDVLGNTVEVIGSVANMVRYGISVGNKLYPGDATLTARSVCNNVRIAGNRVVSHVPQPSSGDGAALGGVYGLCDAAGVSSSPPVNRNIALVDNELVEDDGIFNGFGVRYGIGASVNGVGVDGPSVGVIVRGNYGVASTSAGVGPGVGAVAISGNLTDGTRGIQELTVERNTFRCRTTNANSSAGGIYGNVTGSVVQYNVFQDYVDPF
jgi:hypothetical protein